MRFQGVNFFAWNVTVVVSAGEIYFSIDLVSI